MGAGHAPLRPAGFKALAGLFLLVQREGGLAAEVDTSRLGVGPATRGALEDAAAPQARPSIESQSRNVGKPKATRFLDPIRAVLLHGSSCL